MKKKKYLPLYYTWLESGFISDNGLCNCFGTYFSPTEWVSDAGFEDFQMMFPDNPKAETTCDHYWGAGNNVVGSRHCLFTPLRQNIVLFIAAMNNEL